VDGLTLAVSEGQLFGLLGPNGAGKSTVMKMLVTLLPPTSGNATIAGYDLLGQSAIINVAYGLIAASLAAITGGFVTSDDSAWDWQRLPALPEELLSGYSRPEKAIGDDFRQWSERCLGFLAEELEDGRN
jgi:energy-coupling factor transporter ATP-binding protein EcfA2